MLRGNQGSHNDRQQDERDGRLKALNAAAAGYAAYDAYKLGKDAVGTGGASAGGPQNEAINLKLGIGSQSSSSKTELSQTEASSLIRSN
ncbi:hypothetical protein ABU614_10220 [Lysobacter firmicutimachus]|uniref:Uncharacterized protein n=1 Tax=Lysobacter firmicutimachus TaxID=1792846 RepID=A0AAU8MYZ5_9GAMM